MNAKIRNAALVGAIAAVTASAWAASEIRGNSSYVPKYTVTERVTTTPEPIAVEQSLSPNESVVTEYAVTERQAVAEPVAAPRRAEPVLVTERPAEPITVEERRLTLDERIQVEIMDRLAANSRLSGKIGVESHDAVVTLTGWTPTAAQARHAAADAHSVQGVRYVKNEIRARVGGSV